MAAKPAIAYEREQTLRYTRELALYEVALVQTLRNQRPFTDRVLQAFGLLGLPGVNYLERSASIILSGGPGKIH